MPHLPDRVALIHVAHRLPDFPPDLGKMIFTLARKAFGDDLKRIIKDLKSILVA